MVIQSSCSCCSLKVMLILVHRVILTCRLPPTPLMIWYSDGCCSLRPFFLSVSRELVGFRIKCMRQYLRCNLHKMDQLLHAQLNIYVLSSPCPIQPNVRSCELPFPRWKCRHCRRPWSRVSSLFEAEQNSLGIVFLLEIHVGINGCFRLAVGKFYGLILHRIAAGHEASIFNIVAPKHGRSAGLDALSVGLNSLCEHVEMTLRLDLFH